MMTSDGCSMTKSELSIKSINMTTSVDLLELKKFKKGYADWWDTEHGEFRMLHQITPIRVEYLKSIFAKYIEPNKKMEDIKLLDVGCGGGIISYEMSKLGIKPFGIDANESNVSIAQEHAQNNSYSAQFFHTTVEDYVNNGNKFDVILCLELIEHIINPQEFVSNLAKLLNKGGVIVISTLNRTAKSYLLAIVAAEKILKWVPKQTHDYNKFIKPSELVMMASKSDLELLEMKGLGYSVMDQQWIMKDSLDVNYFAVFKL